MTESSPLPDPQQPRLSTSSQQHRGREETTLRGVTHEPSAGTRSPYGPRDTPQGAHCYQ